MLNDSRRIKKCIDGPHQVWNPAEDDDDKDGGQLFGQQRVSQE